MSTPSGADEPSLLDKLDSIGTPLRSFDAFPKIPSTYKSRSAGGGFVTLGIAVLCTLLVLNDLAEYLWGATSYSFVVDREIGREMMLNVDITVAMPCHFISVDLRDAIGDRLHLSDQFHRDGTLFDTRQATNILTQAADISAQQMIRDARSRSGGVGIFDWMRKRQPPSFQPTFHHIPDGSACRIYGSMEVKKVQANLHVTTLGHGYHSAEHTDHSVMNLSHIITEFSFGPYFPDITQPLDYTIESSDDPFTAFQYFLTVVPTTYKTRSATVHTNQYSVTSTTSRIIHGRGTPGIFFKYDLEPLSLIVEQKTTSLTQFLIRLVGVVGGVWVCAGWGVKVGTKGLEVAGLTKKEDEMPVAAESSGKRSSVLGLDAIKKRQSWAGSISSLAGIGSPAPSPMLNGTFSPPLSGGLGTPSYAQPQFANVGPRQSYSGASTPQSATFLPPTPGVGAHRPSASVSMHRVHPSRSGVGAQLQQEGTSPPGPGPRVRPMSMGGPVIPEKLD